MLIGMIDGVTRVLGKSQGYIGLPVRDEVMIDSTNGQETPTMTTAWFPTPKEIGDINAGNAIYVNLFGERHPPIYLFTGPAAEHEPANPSLAKLELALLEWDQLRQKFADNGNIPRSLDIILKCAIDTYFAERGK